MLLYIYYNMPLLKSKGKRILIFYLMLYIDIDIHRYLFVRYFLKILKIEANTNQLRLVKDKQLFKKDLKKEKN